MKKYLKMYFDRKILNTKNIKACLLQLEDKSREFISERLICSIKSIVPGTHCIKPHTTETTVV